MPIAATVSWPLTLAARARFADDVNGTAAIAPATAERCKNSRRLDRMEGSLLMKCRVSRVECREPHKEELATACHYRQPASQLGDAGRLRDEAGLVPRLNTDDPQPNRDEDRREQDP